MSVTNPDCPFVGAYVNDGNYLISKTMSAFTLIVVPKPGKDTEAFRVAFEELQRARQFGLTATEIDRAYNEMVSQFERIYNNRDKQRSPLFHSAVCTQLPRWHADDVYRR